MTLQDCPRLLSAVWRATRQERVREGNFDRKYREGQEDQLSALGLVVNIVALWNTIYCQAALDRLRSAGSEVATADIARLSPLGHKHINFRGQYKVSHASTPAPVELRPLHGGLTRLFVPLILTGLDGAELLNAKIAVVDVAAAILGFVRMKAHQWPWP